MSDSEIERIRAALADLQARVAALERALAEFRPGGPHDSRAILLEARGESRFGLTAINRIGAVTLAVGVIFFFKYAADNQWIGAGAMVFLGLLAGFALIGTGEWLRTRQQQSFAQGLAGCGFAILYISAYAAFAYSKLLSRGPDFIALLAASTLAIALCFRFTSSAIAAVGFIGAFVAPILLRPSGDHIEPGFYFGYLVLVSVASVFTVLRLYSVSEQKIVLFLAPFNTVWAILCSWILVDTLYPRGFVIFVLAFSAVYFAAAFAVRQTTKVRATFYLCGHGCFLVAALRELAIRTANQPSLTSEIASVLLAIYGVALIAYGLAQRSTLDRLLGLSLIGIVVAKLYLYDVWLLARFYRITALVVLGVLLLVASYIYSRFKSRVEP